MPTGSHLLGRTAPEVPAQSTPPPSLGSTRPLTGATGQPRRRDRAGFIDHRADVTGGQLDEVHPALRTGRPAPTDPVPQLGSRHGTGPAESLRGELQGSTLGTRPGQAARRATATDVTGSGQLGRQASPDATPSRAQQRVADRTRRRAEWEEQRRDQRATSSNGW